MVMNLIEATVDDLTSSEDAMCSSVVLLGAGNCLDVDLPRLTELFSKVHFVDLDRDATGRAIKKAGIASDRIQVTAPADIAEPLLSLTDEIIDNLDAESSPELLQQLASGNGVADVPESDVVVSLCVMSQLFDSLRQLFTENHPLFAHLLQAVRIGHLRRMLSMLRRGGVAILLTDIVSSDTVPDLASSTAESLPPLVRQLVSSGNFFSGTNPANVLRDLNILSHLPDGAESVHTIDPWLWHVGDRAYAVYGLRIQKKLPVEEMPDQELPDAAD